VYLGCARSPEVTLDFFCRRFLSTSAAVTRALHPFRVRVAHPPRLRQPGAATRAGRPILLTAHRCSHQYSHNISEILTLDEHREELETEEALIWYALNHEKESERAEGSQDALDEDDWWKRWPGRTGKRE
jgi:hypothetical protein